MSFVKKYFQEESDAPAPLIATSRTRVRFEEVDSIGIVWHGRYASYLEDGRMALGDMYGLSYHLFKEHSVAAPIVQMHLDYKKTLRFDEQITIETSLHWVESARLNISYIIRNSAGDIAASAYTVQLLTDFAGGTIFITPLWLEEFRAQWRAGKWSTL
ncbi:acyl-CoA thioesterase [Desulforhopalus vacuolatus]|uniref:acyl-CoA thioesterase n=1 Tax=Desulforhopalus vacuolatus TaxID=40414 RepID=UPI0019651901|nr:acyl-CoA thioesterase [Desulforhopalus vacuolatus]MBM9519737.1 acyl-CoA thioesterase [Desulforhopalus vacuolatus]